MKPEMKKLIIANLPYLLFVYLFGKLGQTYRLAAGADLSEKLLHLADGFSLAFESAAPSFHLFDLAVGVAGAVALRLMVYCKSKNAKKYRRGVEYGSARWGGPKDIAPYIDPVFDNNILLTQTERLTMNNRPKDPKTARNKNVLVIGGSGSGKTRFFVKPNLMQCVSKDYPTSFVITDPKGSLIGEVGQLLVRCGYQVKVLNTINFSKSMRYNPFRYIHSEKDILKLVNTLICNTKGEGEKSAEDFWIKSERLLYSALIGYIWYEAPDDEMNFTTLLEMINASEAREDDPEFQSPVDQMFERLEEKDPEHFAVRQYRKFLLSAGKTRSSILISCGARLAPFDIREVRELMEDDELELDTIGDKKTALFLIMSDTDTTFNFILAMVQSQLINLLCDRADDKYGGRLVVGGKEGLQPIEKTVIDRCVRLVYREQALGLETAKTPLLQDLYEELLRQPEPEARRVATALELYCTGSLNLFNHPTNVKTDSRVVCIVLKNMGENLRKIAMHITNEFVSQAVDQNFHEGAATWCYFDEFHILLRDPLTASYFVAVWKMLRKKGCVPSALTQNVKDLLASREIENILDNTDFMILLSQAQSDRTILAKQLGISEHQLSYITHSNSGEGLLFYGNVTIPFVDRFSCPLDGEPYIVKIKASFISFYLHNIT